MRATRFLSNRSRSAKPCFSQGKKARFVPRVFYGWWIVAVSALGLFLGAASIVVYSFSVFLAPLAHEFHSSRGAISFAFTLFGLAGALGALIMGRLIDRFGARKVVIVSTALFALALLSNELFSEKLWELYALFVLLGILGPGTGALSYSNLVSHWFDRHRGLALGLMMLGVGTGATLMPSIAQRVISAFGWRVTYVLFGLTMLLIAVPLPALLLKDRPQNMGLLPDGDSMPRSLVTESMRDQGLSWSKARADATFWSMASAFCLVMAGLQGTLVHLPAMLVDRGSSAQIGALAASCIGAALLVGRVGTGYLLDRFFAPYVAALLFGQAALGILLLVVHGPNWLPFIAAVSVGLGVGAEADLMAYMISRYFGLRSFSEIYSYAWAAFVISVAIGPYLMGLGFDKTGSYRLPLLAFVLAASAAAVLMARIGPYRFGPQRPAPAALEVQAEIVNP